MPLSTKNNRFFALTIQQHRQLGVMLGAFYIEESESGDIFSIKENVITEAAAKLDILQTEEHRAIVKQLTEVTEKSLQKHFAKNAKSVAEFTASLPLNEQLSSYVRGYIDRRIAKCIDIAQKANIPIFIRDKISNSLYIENKLEVEKEHADPLFRFELTPEELKYSISVAYRNKRVSIAIGNSEIITNEPCTIRIQSRIYQVQNIDGKKFGPFINKSHIVIPKSAEQKYMETFVLNTIRNQLVEAIGFSIIETSPKPENILTLEEKLSGGACLTLSFRYDDKKYLCNEPLQPEVLLKKENGQYIFTKFKRDEIAEKSAIELLTKSFKLVRYSDAEFILSNVKSTDSDSIHSIVEWINVYGSKLEDAGFLIDQSYSNKEYYLRSVDLNVSASSSEDWFDLYGKVKLGDFEIPFIYLKKNIVKGIREFTLPNGQLFVLPEVWFAKYKPLFLVGKEQNTSLKIPKSLFNLLIDNQVDAPTAYELRDKFSKFNSSGIALPKHINAKLRDYQVQGFVWLNMLRQNSINGCLADDMGLGKTLQTLTLLQSIKEETEQLPSGVKTSLVVVPTSLIHNWRLEINKFVPDMRLLIYAGTQRVKSESYLKRFDIIITTYGTVRNDIELLKNVDFRYIILDESQTIKNPFSKIYRSVLLLKASNFLSLSGTPIENSLTDLWAQLNFLNRGMLGSLKSFRDEYQIPIEKNNDTEKEKQLKFLIEPTILRRTKEQVAKDLPPLTEQIVYCEMSESQQDVYEKEKSIIRNSIIDTIEHVGFEKSSISILSGLMRLRQIANHPALLDEYGDLDSGKFDEVTRSIEGIVAENHKMLIFSSFVKHLEQVEEFLKKENIGYEMLTGETTNRAKVVEEFQNNQQKQVFLISLKAGGVGLNLTAADYVFILDPWWNPAAEMQATSRAHRIGQNKSVFVYRFISLNTVEEKILKLQAKKENLAQIFVDSNNPLKLIDKDVIMELIE